jgi:hypothetical protein
VNAKEGKVNEQPKTNWKYIAGIDTSAKQLSVIQIPNVQLLEAQLKLRDKST